MTRYLLDTNILSDLLRNPQGAAAKRIAHVGEKWICTSIIVSSELRYGIAKRGSAPLARRVEGLLARLEILSFDQRADLVYGQIRARLEATGRQIGALDMLIAAHALALEHTLVTDNEREFRRVDGLSVENWLR